jgi:Immunoglobulin I-set domain
VVLESEQQPPAEESAPSAENVSQEPPKSETVGDENKPADAEAKADDASVEKPVEGVGANVEQPKPVEGETKVEATAVEGEKPKEGDDKLEMAGSETTIESDIDSDFDVMEEIDPSWAIEATLWQKVADLSTVDLKPAAAVVPVKEGEEPAKAPEKKKKEEVVEEEEDSGFSEIVIRSEKDRDQEFREYIFELCRPSIVSYLPDRVAAKGSDVRLTCTVKGNNVQVKWMKDEVPLERKANVQYRSDGEIHILEITKISDREAGEYTAVFKNRAGEVETSSRIKVFDGKLHKPEHVDVALVKGKSTLLCFV